MNPNHTYMDHDGAIINRGPDTVMDGVAPVPNHEPLDIDGMFPNHEWAQLALLQGFDEHPGELAEPAINEQPPLNNVNNTPPEPLPNIEVETPMAANAEHPPKPSPGINGHRYTCQACPFASNIKRDYGRHLRTRKHRSNARTGGDHGASGLTGPNTTGFRCPVQDCRFNASGKTFSRDDHLWRHIRMVHDIKKQV